MELSDNKAVVRRFLEESVAQGNFEVYDTSFSANFVLHLSGTSPHSHASFRKMVEQFHQAMAGQAFTFHDLIAEGDTVATRYSWSTTMHHAQFGNNPPTGQPILTESTAFFHFEQGKVTEAWIYYEGADWDLSSFSQ